MRLSDERPTVRRKGGSRANSIASRRLVSLRPSKTFDELLEEAPVVFRERESYQGETALGRRHGQGTFHYPNTYFRYVGSWKNNRKHGKGVLLFQDGTRMECLFQNGEMCGEGKRQYPDGASYEGFVLEGEPHGKGAFWSPTGEQYTGDWRFGWRDGIGLLRLRNGMVYEGEFKRHTFHGRGELTAPDGSRWVGGWERGLLHGESCTVETADDSAKYTGSFCNGERSGLGEQSWGGSYVYSGVWKGGRPANPSLSMQVASISTPSGTVPFELSCEGVHAAVAKGANPIVLRLSTSTSLRSIVVDSRLPTQTNAEQADPLLRSAERGRTIEATLWRTQAPDAAGKKTGGRRTPVPVGDVTPTTQLAFWSEAKWKHSRRRSGASDRQRQSSTYFSSPGEQFMSVTAQQDADGITFSLYFPGNAENGLYIIKLVDATDYLPNPGGVYRMPRYTMADPGPLHRDTPLPATPPPPPPLEPLSVVIEISGK